MSNYKITIDTGTVAGLMVNLTDQMQAAVTEGLKAVAEETHARWIEAIKKAPKIWYVERNRYIQSLAWKLTSPFSAEVWTDYEVADWIENGRPARDLKQYLNTSQRVRRTEDGRRFLIIPFRHNTPGHSALAPSMSPQAYAIAKGMKRSSVTADNLSRPVGQVMHLSPRTGMSVSPHQTPFLSSIKTRGQAMFDKATHYAWGDRLSAKTLRAAGMDDADVRKYAGMVRMKDSAGKNRAGGYLTFRVMIEGQSGWIVPAKPGLHIVQAVAAEAETWAPEIISKALQAAVGR